MKRSGVCIVECVDDDDPGSEGRLLREVLRLMQVDCDLVRVRCIEALFKAVADADKKYVHVSTHGALTEDDGFAGWWTQKDHGSKGAVKRLEPRTECTAIVSTACKSGAPNFGEYVVNTLGAKYYIAPLGKPSFYNAALFCHIYYHKLFRTEHSVGKAFKSYEERYKNPHRFTLYKRTAT